VWEDSEALRRRKAQYLPIADSGRYRSAFRDEADHYSVLIPIRIPV